MSERKLIKPHTIHKCCLDIKVTNETVVPSVFSLCEWLNGYENGKDQTVCCVLCTGIQQSVKSLPYAKVEPVPNPPYAIRVLSYYPGNHLGN